MLHFANGDTTAALLKQAGVPGEVVSFDLILMDGPPPELGDLRPAYLERLGIPRGQYLPRAEACLGAVERAAAEEACVVWSEADVYCQVHLVYLLAHLPHPGRVRVICPDGRLGSRPAPELARLFAEPGRRGEEMAALARQAWAAWGADDPSDLEDLARSDQPDWPELPPVLSAHLLRFPSAGNGLSRLEEALLRLLAAGPMSFRRLFPALLRDEHAALLGVGNHQVQRLLLELASASQPLVQMEGLEAGAGWPEQADPTLRLTATGRRVLDGEADLADVLPFDRWLGGVHLRGRPSWRWDATASRLVRGS